MLLLLVDPDAEAAAERIALALSSHAALRVTPATSAIAARAYLSGAAFDAVACRDRVEAAALQALSDVLGVAVEVTVHADEPGLVDWLRARLGTPSVGGSSVGGSSAGEPSAGGPSAGAPGPRVAPEAAREALETVQRELATLAHALNNPLAVVAGNAQLGRELALAAGAGADVTEAFESIDAAAASLAALTSEIGRLRAHIDRVLAGGL